MVEWAISLLNAISNYEALMRLADIFRLSSQGIRLRGKNLFLQSTKRTLIMKYRLNGSNSKLNTFKHYPIFKVCTPKMVTVSKILSKERLCRA